MRFAFPPLPHLSPQKHRKTRSGVRARGTPLALLACSCLLPVAAADAALAAVWRAGSMALHAYIVHACAALRLPPARARRAARAGVRAFARVHGAARKTWRLCRAARAGDAARICARGAPDAAAGSSGRHIRHLRRWFETTMTATKTYSLCHGRLVTAYHHLFVFLFSPEQVLGGMYYYSTPSARLNPRPLSSRQTFFQRFDVL